MYNFSVVYRQLSVICGNGVEEGHEYPKTTVKTKVKTWYKMNVILTYIVKMMSGI
jgi:hypothetical protein